MAHCIRTFRLTSTKVICPAHSSILFLAAARVGALRKVLLERRHCAETHVVRGFLTSLRRTICDETLETVDLPPY